MNVQPGKPPSQIDYIFVSQRWASSARCFSAKWGLPIAAYGRKYDHALVQMKFKLRLKCDNSDKRKDFKALNNPEVSELHEAKLTEALAQSNQPASVQEQWERLTSSLTAAQEAIPSSERKSHRKWETSEHTLLLIKKREEKWPSMSTEERKVINKQISRSARNDYRNYVDNVLSDMDSADQTGNSREVYRLSKQLANNKSGKSFIQPTTDLQGEQIVSSDSKVHGQTFRKQSLLLEKMNLMLF